jgi:hypothetical protein
MITTLKDGGGIYIYSFDNSSSNKQLMHVAELCLLKPHDDRFLLELTTMTGPFLAHSPSGRPTKRRRGDDGNHILYCSCVCVKGLRRGVGSMRSEAVARLPEDAGKHWGPDRGCARFRGTWNPVDLLYIPDVCGGRTAEPACWCGAVGKGNKGLYWARGMAANNGWARVCVLRNFGGRSSLAYYAVLRSC